MKGFASWRRKCVFVRFPTNRSMSDATGEYLYRQMICSVRYGENGDAWTGGGEAYKVVRRGRFGLDLMLEDWGILW